jgi:signal transduction histidine kinase
MGEGKGDERTAEAIPVRRVGTDLRVLLGSTMAPLQEQARGLDVDLRIETAADVPPSMSLDPEKIAWAVATLVGNAFRYVRRGTRRMPGGSIVVTSSYDPARKEIAILVVDDGPGIPADKLPWLFKRAAGGTHAAGLGLMLVHDVATAHGGAVDVRSTTAGPERGTAITLHIPVREAP